MIKAPARLVYYGRIWTNFDEYSGSSHGENESSYVLREHHLFEIQTGKGSSPLSSVWGGELAYQYQSGIASSSVKVVDVKGCMWGDYEDYRGKKSCGYLPPYEGAGVERTGSVDGHDGWQWDGGYASAGGKVGGWDKEGAQEAINGIRQYCARPDQKPDGMENDFEGIEHRLCSNYLGFYECLGDIREECSKINNGNIPLESVEFRVLKK